MPKNHEKRPKQLGREISQPADFFKVENNPEVKVKHFHCDKEVVDFGLKTQLIPVNTNQLDSFTITNNSKPKAKFTIETPEKEGLIFKMKPSKGILKQGKPKTIKISLKVKKPVNANIMFKITDQDGNAQFLTAKVRCSGHVFGVDPKELKHVDDDGLMVPEVLVTLKQYLLENDAINQEGIFRLAGDVADIELCKSLINREQDLAEALSDLNVAATIIKIWYRELPTPVLNTCNHDKLFYSEDQAVCAEAFNEMPEREKTYLEWLLRLMLYISSNSEKNKMTIQNLAIVVAPNLYDVSSVDPMEGLVMSQKVVQFLQNLLSWYTENQKSGGDRGGNGKPSPPSSRKKSSRRTKSSQRKRKEDKDDHKENHKENHKSGETAKEETQKTPEKHSSRKKPRKEETEEKTDENHEEKKHEEKKHEEKKHEEKKHHHEEKKAHDAKKHHSKKK